MIKMMKFSIKLVLLICLTVTHAQYCTSKRGCTVQELSDELVHRDDENLYQVLSWDIRNEKVSVICDVVRNIEDIMVSSRDFFLFGKWNKLVSKKVLKCYLKFRTLFFSKSPGIKKMTDF